jgi:RNA polymerase subunit RPABC4/transcription elongation factor Spt4
MYDSRQFLQFMVDRRLLFDSGRNLMFNAERNLIFNPERNLLFDAEREMYFGKVGPVFRGQACPNCRNLVHPLEDQCRHCGGHVVPLRQVVPTKRRRTTHRPKRKARVQEGAPQPMVRREVRAQEVTPQQVQVIDEGGKQVCPNCSLKIPADAVYCPRCRVKLDEWRKYIQDLRRWEAEQARSAQGGSDRFYDVPSRRRR